MERQDFCSFLTHWLGGLVRNSPGIRKPVMVGLSAPQGAGKTTLMRQVCRLALEDGLRAVSVSIDDFYITRCEQIDLAARYSDNPYLQHRGYPGTHDIAFGTRVLNALKSIDEHGRVVVPSYDRSAHGGWGDRRPKRNWPVVHGPLDLAILEGWMLGFTAVSPEVLPDPHFHLINENLRRYAAWYSYLDAFVFLEPEEPHYTLDWRVEAEERAKAAGTAGMSPDEVKAFAAKFLPAYLVYLPRLREQPPCEGPFLHVLIGRDRLPKPGVPFRQQHSGKIDRPALSNARALP